MWTFIIFIILFYSLLFYSFLFLSGIERTVHNEQALVTSIKASLKSEYKLVDVGAFDAKYIAYSSIDSETHWMRTAYLFTKSEIYTYFSVLFIVIYAIFEISAVAVIGPHGGAFGNTFLCTIHIFPFFSSFKSFNCNFYINSNFILIAY
jgi:hypothetical protein